MKYCCEVTIAQPRERVIELFDNPDNLHHWQPGLLSFEPVSGTPGQPGAKSRLRFLMRSRQIEMIETITERRLPEWFCGTYEAPGVFNTVRNQFVAEGPNATRWIAENEFAMRGLFMKLMGWLMPGAFKKQSMKYMVHFKTFAETGASVAAETA